MGKKSIKSCLKGMLPDMVSLRRKVQAALKAHPEMFVDVESTNSQVTGFTFSVSFEKNKSTGEMNLLCMDAWLGHLKKPHATLVMDHKDSVTLEEKNA